MASTQLGSTLAKSLFGQVGPLGMVLLRRLAQNPLAFVAPPRDKPAD